MTQPPETHSQTPHIVFLLDVDNTLFDNDRFKNELAAHLTALLGQERSEAFWQLYEEVRKKVDYVDYPTTVRRWGEEFRDPDTLRKLDQALEDMDFPSYVYPHALESIDYLWTLGTAVILSDGDSVFQPQKIKRSGLEAAVHGNVLVYVHKENEIPEVFRRFPGDHYVIVDDKPRILFVLEQCCPTTFTTIHVLQGHYATEGEYAPGPDITINRIGDLCNLGRKDFLRGYLEVGSATTAGAPSPSEVS